MALAGAKELQAAVKAGDAKAAQAAWIKSRSGWEAAEPITGEFFDELDEAIDAWPDAKHGYHAIEAALFSGKLDGVARRPTSWSPISPRSKSSSRRRASRSRRKACSTAPASSPTRSARTNRRAASRPMPAPRSSTCRRTSRASRRSTSWCSRPALKSERRQARQGHPREDRRRRGPGEGQGPEERSTSRRSARRARSWRCCLQNAAPKLGLKTPKLGD